MKVTVVCVGKLKEKYWRDAIAEYSKRLSRYMKLEIIELADEKAPENMSDAQAAEVKEREGQRMPLRWRLRWKERCFPPRSWQNLWRKRALAA